MAERHVRYRITSASQGKGQISTQTYLGNTDRTVSTKPAGYIDTRTQIGTANRTTTTTRGNVQETRTTSGVGKTSIRTEDKGVILKFRIPIQQRNPVVRSSP